MAKKTAERKGRGVTSVMISSTPNPALKSQSKKRGRAKGSVRKAAMKKCM